MATGDVIFGPGDITVVSGPLEVAFTQLHQGEAPGEHNRGRWPDIFTEWSGHDPEAELAWCGSALMWWHWRAGFAHERTAGVGAIRSWARRNGLLVPLDQVKAGDGLLRVIGVGRNHCGIARADYVAGQPYWTVEGNTNAAGSREGRWILAKERPVSYFNFAFRSHRISPTMETT